VNPEATAGVEPIQAEHPPAVAGNKSYRLDDIVEDGLGDEVVQADADPAGLDALASQGDLALELV